MPETLTPESIAEIRRMLAHDKESYGSVWTPIVESLLERIDKCMCDVPDSQRIQDLEAFKAYVHGRLDAAGIPTHPDGPHSKEGCRIGDRLDIALKVNADG